MIIKVTYMNDTAETFTTEELEHDAVGIHLDGTLIDSEEFSVTIPWSAIRKVERIA
jgi:hypothetical protein